MRPLALALSLLLPAAACGQGVSRQAISRGASAPSTVVNVRAAPFNAVGDGVSDDTAAIQAALDSGAGKPITVYLPPGTYRVAPRDAPTMDLAVGHCLYINFDNVHLLGDGAESSVIRAYVRGGLDPVTNWDVSPLVGVWRGSTIYMSRPAGNAVRRNTEIKGLRLTGQTPRSSSSYASITQPVPFPPSPTTGDGWGGYHSAIMFAPGMSADHFWVSDSELDSYRAEITISQGATYAQTDFRIDRTVIHDSLGNGINFAANIVVADSEVHTTQQALEIYHYQADATVERCWMHDNYRSISDGGNIAITPANYGLFTIRHNLFERNYFGGIFVLGFTARINILDNDFVDDGWPGYGSLLIGTLYGATPKDVIVERNRVYADEHTVNMGFLLNSDAGYPQQNWVIRDNQFRRTALARANGHVISSAIQANLYNGDSDEILIERNDASDAGAAQLSGANLMWVAHEDQETADTLAPVMRFRRQATMTLYPAQARVYTAWTLAPEDVPIMVKLGPNATIEQSATVRLAGGTSFAPGGTGGVITFVRPSGATVLYEVSRFAY